ncbi:hypothetical protein PIB30_109351, partial [Stylosanthes scabra]|nr:hypothetical protein [Stylosanthes scabra]
GMGELYVVPVFHHGGKFVRHPNGELVYADGDVHRFNTYELDVDTLNLRDMVVMVEELGYKSHNAILWFDKTAPELETGLNELDGDEAIRDLIDWLRENRENEFHVFIEHPIDKPILAENDGGGEGVPVEQVHLVDGSLARDEATKEDAFETPHPGTDSQNADEIRASRSRRKRKARSPKQKEPLNWPYEKQFNPTVLQLRLLVYPWGLHEPELPLC